jgi:hypothetical protein
MFPKLKALQSFKNFDNEGFYKMHTEIVEHLMSALRIAINSNSNMWPTRGRGITIDILVLFIDWMNRQYRLYREHQEYNSFDHDNNKRSV